VIIRISDRLMFRNEEIVISADIISISQDFITFKTVEPFEGLKDYICRWNENYKPQSWKAAARELEEKRAGLNFSFDEFKPAISLSLSSSNGLINNQIFHNGTDSVIITDELLKELLTYLKVLFIKVFAYIENRKKIFKIFEEVKYNELKEIVINKINHLIKSSSNQYLTIEELIFNKTIDEAVLNEMLQKVENICKYRIDKDLFFKLINEDKFIKKIFF